MKHRYGREALRLIREQQLRPDLLLSDVIMPMMNGRELFDEMRKELPKLRVVFMSGYTDDVLQDRGGITGRRWLSSQTLYLPQSC